LQELFVHANERCAQEFSEETDCDFGTLTDFLLMIAVKNGLEGSFGAQLFGGSCTDDVKYHVDQSLLFIVLLGVQTHNL